jgi:hypothetical protein
LAESGARWGFLDKDFPYTARILHEIGKVALTATMPEAYARVGVIMTGNLFRRVQLD